MEAARGAPRGRRASLLSSECLPDAVMMQGIRSSPRSSLVARRRPSMLLERDDGAPVWLGDGIRRWDGSIRRSAGPTEVEAPNRIASSRLQQKPGAPAHSGHGREGHRMMTACDPAPFARWIERSPAGACSSSHPGEQHDEERACLEPPGILARPRAFLRLVCWPGPPWNSRPPKPTPLDPRPRVQSAGAC